MGASATVVEAIDQTEVAMMLVGVDHTVSYANGAAHDLLGYEHGALNGLSLRWLSPPSRHGELQNLDAVFAGQGMRRIRSLALRSDGSRMEVAMKLEPCRDATGKVVAASVTYEPLSAGSSTHVSQPPSSIEPRMSYAPRISQLPSRDVSAHAGKAPANANQAARPASAPVSRSAHSSAPARPSTPSTRPASSQPARPSQAGSTPTQRPTGSQPARSAQPASSQPLPKASAAATSAAPARPSAPPAPPTRPPAPPTSAIQPRAQTPSAPVARSAPPPPPRSSAPAAPASDSSPSWVTASLTSRRPQPTAKGLAPLSSAPPPPPSAPPQSGSRPIVASAPAEAKAPPRQEAFATISEQLESAVQLLGWLEAKLNAGEAGVDERDRTRALVVLSDLQAIIAESKGLADAEAGGVDIPKAPRLPRM